MTELQSYRLSEIAEIGMGQSPDSSSYNADGRGYPFLQGCAEFGKRYPNTASFCDMPTRIAPQGSILISVRAPVGEINRADQDYCIGRGLAYVFEDVASIDYLYYALQHNRQALERVSQGSTFQAINSRELASLAIRCPPLPEQRKIAHILTTVDDLIDRTEALIAKLRAIKQGLMHDLLTRGVDEHGQVRPPCEEAPELYKESAVGWVPREWEVCPIEDKLHRIIDYRGKTPHKTTEGIQLITARNVREGFFDPEPKEFIAEETYDSWMTRGIPQPGDVLFTTEAPLGNVARVPDYRVALGQRILTLCVDFEVLDSSYLFWLLLSPVSQQQIVQRSTGSTVLGIKQSRFRRIPLPFPAFQEQRIIGKILDSHNDRAREEESLHNKLEQVKTGLMQDLLTGRIRVNLDKEE